MKKGLKISDNDNVITLLESVKEGDEISFGNESIKANQDTKTFHKIAIKDIKKDDIVYKYGQVIGDALEDINIGDHVHTHNIESTRGRGDKNVKGL